MWITSCRRPLPTQRAWWAGYAAPQLIARSRGHLHAAKLISSACSFCSRWLRSGRTSPTGPTTTSMSTTPWPSNRQSPMKRRVRCPLDLLTDTMPFTLVQMLALSSQYVLSCCLQTAKFRKRTRTDPQPEWRSGDWGTKNFSQLDATALPLYLLDSAALLLSASNCMPIYTNVCRRGRLLLAMQPC
jgi:hypothetical protein